MKKIKIIMAALLVSLAPMAAFARWGNYCWYDNFPGQGSWFGHHFFGGGIFMFLTYALIIGVLIFFGYNFFKSKKVIDSRGENPLDILKQRYAKGEITKAEFEGLKKDLS